jgi:LysM repeat protein
MKSTILAGIFALLPGLAAVSTPAIAQQTVTESINMLDEKLGHLQAQVEDLQFKQQQMQKDIAKLQSDLQDLRRPSGGGVSSGDIQALQTRIDAIDAARQKDKQAIVDQLAKELASISAGKSGTKGAMATAAPPSDGEGKEHVVAKGENLTTIAKACGVSVEDLKKANNISNPNDIKVGQKLIIPK